MWPFSRKKKKQKQEEKEVKTSKPVEEKKEPVKTEKKEEVKEVKAPKKEEPKVETKKVEKTESKAESAEGSEDKKRTDTYHVSKRSKDGKWQVKFGGSDKPIKLFDTQAEALEYAKELSQKYDKSLTIHKKDGKIRKQKY